MIPFESGFVYFGVQAKSGSENLPKTVFSSQRQASTFGFTLNRQQIEETMTIDEIYEASLRLPIEEREQLSHRLLSNVRETRECESNSEETVEEVVKQTASEFGLSTSVWEPGEPVSFDFERDEISTTLNHFLDFGYRGSFPGASGPETQVRRTIEFLVSNLGPMPKWCSLAICELTTLVAEDRKWVGRFEARIDPLKNGAK